MRRRKQPKAEPPVSQAAKDLTTHMSGTGPTQAEALSIVRPFVCADETRSAINQPIGFEMHGREWIAGTDGYTLCAVRLGMPCVPLARRENQAPVVNLFANLDGWTSGSEVVTPDSVDGFHKAMLQLTKLSHAILLYDPEHPDRVELDAYTPRKTGKHGRVTSPEYPLVKGAWARWAPPLGPRVKIAFDARYLLRGLQAFDVSACAWLGPGEFDPLVLVPAGETATEFSMAVLVMPTRV